jgi:hypothetical protein
VAPRSSEGRLGPPLNQQPTATIPPNPATHLGGPRLASLVVSGRGVPLTVTRTAIDPPPHGLGGGPTPRQVFTSVEITRLRIPALSASHSSTDRTTVGPQPKQDDGPRNRSDAYDCDSVPNGSSRSMASTLQSEAGARSMRWRHNTGLRAIEKKGRWPRGHHHGRHRERESARPCRVDGRDRPSHLPRTFCCDICAVLMRLAERG